MKQPLLHLAAGLLLYLPASLARAEGSRELTPNTPGTTATLTNAANTRAGYLTHDFNNIVAGQYQSQGFLKSNSWSGPNRPFSKDYRLLVRLKPNETLFYGVHRIASENGSGNQDALNLTLKYDNSGTEIQAASNTLPYSTERGNTRRSLLAPGAGVINSAAEVQAGPKVAGTASASTGYDPLTYTNTTGVERDFWVEFSQVGEGDMSQTQKISQYDFWDFTVRTNAGPTGQEVKGRLHSKFWSFTTGAFANRLSATFSLYPLVESVRQPGRYYVKEVELAGMNPYAFYFVTNAKGTSRTGNFVDTRMSQTTEKTYPEYENFINDPDPLIWPSAPLPVFSRTVQPFCNPITGKGAAAFTTTSEEAGSTSVLIDINNNGVQDGNDVVIEQTVTANVPATVYWNGLDNVGNQVAAGTTLRLTFISNGAPVNFPLFDVEGNADGLRVQNVRPSQGGNRFFDRLYWDDRNLTTATSGRFPATRPAPDLSNYRPDGVISEQGVHRWTGATNNQGGDNYTVNTWTYGFISAAAEQVYTFNFKCDFDSDGIADKDDVDDDNDGIPDVLEAFGINPQTTTTNGVATNTGNGVLVYLDAAYMHPVLGAFRDINRDGINDIFDTDLDGLPNHLDLDSDGDGLPDAFEASGNLNPTWTFGTSAYNPAQAKFTGAVGANGLPDAAEARVTNGPEVNVTRHSLPDRDADARTVSGVTASNYNFLDLDSDNDGITDEIEAQSTSAYMARKGQANFNTDANGNGIRDAYEGAGAISSVVNLDGDAQADIFDLDSDNDNDPLKLIAEQTADWTEGFDENGNGFAGDEIVAKAQAFSLANPGKASYYVVSTDAAGRKAPLLSIFLQDDDKNGIPNFLQVGHPTYHDDNFNGLVDIYDPAYSGSPSTAPLVGGAGTEAIFRSNTKAVPLPVTLVEFKAQAMGRDALVSWTTAMELNSASFVVESSFDGSSFVAIATLSARGNSTQRTDYRTTDKNAGAQAGLRYYRLLQLDLDGTVNRSDVKTVRFDGKGSTTTVRLFPNPASADVTLDLAQLPAGTYRVEVLGAEGRKVAEWPANGGQEQVLPTQNLAKGVYLLRISGYNTTQVIKLVKN